MKELPYIEEIYDFETEQLESLLQEIDQMLLQGANGNQSQVELPKGFESFDKFERKALKLKESLELELEERRQVDDVISFFVNQTGSGGSGNMFGNNNLLNDDEFYKPMSNPITTTTTTNNNNNNNQLDSVMQKHNQSQMQSQLNQQNLNKLPSQQQFLQTNNNVNTARGDDKLETDTNFSQYMKQSTDDTQSLYTAPANNKQHDEDSEMSKRMYANRVGGMGSNYNKNNNNNANKNKKGDIGAFMREKLAKTKIASESMGVIQQSIAINPNNFAKKKKLDSDDNKSVISSSQNNNNTQSDKQTIYKPNLKRKQSTTTSVKPNITSTTKISSNMVSGTVQGGISTTTSANRKSSTSRGGAQQSSVTRKAANKDDNVQSQPLIKKQQTQKPPQAKSTTTTSVQDNKQNTTATSSIYKPSNMSSTTVSINNSNNATSTTGGAGNKSRGSSNRPPMPSTSKSSKQPQSSTATTIDVNQQQKDKNASNIDKNNTQDQLNTWDNKQEDNIHDMDDQQLLGQEEIESKYDDGDNDTMSHSSAYQHNQRQQLQANNNNININNYVLNEDEDELQQQEQQQQKEDEAREEQDDDDDVDNSREDKKFKVSDLLSKVEVSNPQKKKANLSSKNSNHDNHKNTSDDEEEKKQNNYQNDDNSDDDGEEDQDFYQPIGDSDIKPKVARKEPTTFQSDQDKLKRIFDYDEQQQSNAVLDNAVSQSQQLTNNNNQKLIDTSSNNQLRVQQLNIQTEPSSTTSKKIRGKVQIFVDETALNSVQQTPKTTIIPQSQQQQQQQQNDMISSQIRMLEEQDKQLNDPNTYIPTDSNSNNNSNNNANKQQNKRMEQLKQLMNQGDDQQRKQEQEDRMKQIRDQIQKDREQKNKHDQQQQQQQQQQYTSNQQDDKLKAIEEVKQTEEIKSKQTTKTTSGKTVTTTKKQQQSNKKDDKQLVSKIPRQPDGHDQYIDYSGHYKTFYEIFVGQLLDPKNFDVQFVIRDTRNTYAAFVNIMDSSAINLKRKFQFEQAPLEKSLQDYYKALPDFFSLTGKNINELEQEMKNRGNQIMMMQAMAQQQLKNNFQQLKSKDVNDIVKEAHEKAAQSAAGQNNGKTSLQNQLIEENRESSLYYRVVKNRTEVYDIISRAFSRKSKWNELPHGLDLKNTWNLMWTWSKIKIDITKLIVWQKCNHFNGAKNVSRKDFLKRNIERAQKMSAKAGQVFNMLPLTFILPKEYVGFLESFSEFEDKEGQLNYWIMKPAAKSRGRGISLVNDLTQITYGEPIVVQRYIKNPLLINGYKFDMRIYVVVTSVNPLEVFLYKEGFGRFSTMPFSLDPTDRANKYIHLTNVSIQKYNVNNSDQDPNDLLYGGTKISIQTLKKRVQQAVNVNWDDQIWPQIRDVVLKSMVACQNDIQFNPSCFELFGFDILIDSDMKCWLIEINSSPSLARETLLDDMIKQKLIDDIVDLVDPVDFDRKRLFEVLERRINEDFKQSTTSNAYSKKLMNRDLTYILNGQVPRKYGEMPKQMGNFERIAPSPQSEAYLKLIGGQKMFGSMMKMQGEGDKPK